MKKILVLILLSSITLSAHAASLAPSLQTQMKKQEVVNKQKTALEKKLAIQERKKQNAEKVATLRANRQTVLAQNSASKSNTTVTPTSPVGTTKTNIAPTVVKTTAIASNNTVSSPSQAQIAWVDMARVRSTWISWYNTGRATKWLGAYSYDSRLDNTAHDWNTVFAASRGTNFHERNSWDGYYNYAIINKWFQDRWVNPPVVSGVNHSENVSYGYYVCSKADCTDDFINSIRSSYIFFINSAVHSRSVYQPNFTKIGFDVIVVPSERRYYITVHYMTK